MLRWINDAKEGDTFTYVYQQAEDTDKEYKIKIDGVLTMPQSDIVTEEEGDNNLHISISYLE